VPRTHWARWTAALKREHPRLTILGEMWDGNPRLVAFFQGGRRAFDGVDSGIDTLFDFPMHYALRDVFAKGQPMTRLAETLAADTNYVDPRVLVTFLGLHDTSRFLNEEGATVEGLQLAFTCLLTLRGTPLIYYGDEIALRGGGDPDNRRDFPGGWPEDARTAFTKTGRTVEQAGVFDHVRRLLHLRREVEPLRRGRLVELGVTPATYSFARVTAHESVIVALNNSSEPQVVDLGLTSLPGGVARSVFRDRLGVGERVRPAGGRLRIKLPARGAALLVP
jgi:glycosidase